MRLPSAVRRELLDLAVQALPEEACGLLGGTGDRVVVVRPCANRAASPCRYEIAPQDVLRALREFAAAGLDALGIFHSHPAGTSAPSATDLREAAWPELVHVIVGMTPRPALAAFRLGDGVAQEEPLDAP